MFYDINHCGIANYADINTPYASSKNLDAVINKLEESTNNLFQWFRNNHKKVFPDKCHFWLYVTIKPLQILINLQLQAVKMKNY